MKIGGQEVMLKDRVVRSSRARATRPGAAPKKGLITQQERRARFISLCRSMDVKIEGENVVRMLDLTTHNHACSPANGALPTVHAATKALGKFDKCEGDKKKIEDNCKKDTLINVLVCWERKSESSGPSLTRFRAVVS
ncbi:MAG: DUF4150 domain-containing protein [Chromatiales bacterium]|nr:DUF4150 domain-containing protein [Chromatiales bacterium]